MVFLLNVMGYFPLFLIQHQQIRSDVRSAYKEYSSGLNLVLVTIEKNDANSFRWYNNDEFAYNGEFFDVVKTDKDSVGNIYYWCVKDTKEKKLLAHFEREVNKNSTNSKDQKNSNRIIKNPIKDYFFHRIMIPDFNEERLDGFHVNDYCLVSNVLDVVTPPPKLSLS